MGRTAGTWDYIVVGQGLCGTLLGHALSRAGKSLLFIDQGLELGTSLGAAGMIHPLSGKRWTQWPEYAKFLNQAASTYTQLEEELGVAFWRPMDIVLFRSATDNPAYVRSLRLYPGYYRQREPESESMFPEIFAEPLDKMVIHPGWRLDAAGLLRAYRNRLQNQGNLWVDRFDYTALQIQGQRVLYKGHRARGILFAEGSAGAHNPWFRDYPFALHRGQALLISAPAIPRDYAYRHGEFMLIPWKEDQFWVGASHERHWEEGVPDLAYRDRVREALHSLIGVPFTYLHSWSGIRPSTQNRQPFWGFHPEFPTLGILNGMGSRAMLLAPYHAQAFARKILERE